MHPLFALVLTMSVWSLLIVLLLSSQEPAPRTDPWRDMCRHEVTQGERAVIQEK